MPTLIPKYCFINRNNRNTPIPNSNRNTLNCNFLDQIFPKFRNVFRFQPRLLYPDLVDVHFPIIGRYIREQAVQYLMGRDVQSNKLQDGAVAQLASHGWNRVTISNGGPEDAQSGAERPNRVQVHSQRDVCFLVVCLPEPTGSSLHQMTGVQTGKSWKQQSHPSRGSIPGSTKLTFINMLLF